MSSHQLWLMKMRNHCIEIGEHLPQTEARLLAQNEHFHHIIHCLLKKIDENEKISHDFNMEALKIATYFRDYQKRILECMTLHHVKNALFYQTIEQTIKLSEEYMKYLTRENYFF